LIQIPAFFLYPIHTRTWINSEYTFTFGAGANVVLCGQNKTFEDVNVGDRVKVVHREIEGGLVADTVIMTAPIIACPE